MSVINRLIRAVESMSSYELEGKDRGGIRGEQFVEHILDDEDYFAVQNPIIPHPRKQGFFLETDMLVYTQGTLYCIEVKNFQGTVYYPDLYKTVYEQRGWFIFKRTIPKTVRAGYDYEKMVQEKPGEPPREMPNPLLKTQHYIDDLKRYLQRIEPRLAHFPIYPVLVFAGRADTRAVLNFDGGILQARQLPNFIEKYSNPSYPKRTEPWIRAALQRLPTWDRIWTTNNEMFYGSLTDPNLTFKERQGRTRTIPYAHIHSLTLRRDGNFSAYDELQITYTNGTTQSFQSSGGEIRLNRFKGEQQVHKLRNINKLVVGITNKI